MENRIKECQLDLFADRTSANPMRANQLRRWFASMAYVMVAALRRIGLKHTQIADATCGSIRLKLQDRRPRHRQCATGQNRYGLSLPMGTRVRARPRLAGQCRALTNQTPHSQNTHRNNHNSAVPVNRVRLQTKYRKLTSGPANFPQSDRREALRNTMVRNAG
jgi:hypothetical protein